jgi:glyoxylase-like metal-dependent hydrolase (beta-lactamase superfamily II)
MDHAETTSWFSQRLAAASRSRSWALDGDAEILPGLSVVTTPGHTVGHQSVVVSTDNGAEVLIGDAVYKRRQYLEPDDGDLPPGQASDPAA